MKKRDDHHLIYDKYVDIISDIRYLLFTNEVNITTETLIQAIRLSPPHHDYNEFFDIAMALLCMGCNMRCDTLERRYIVNGMVVMSDGLVACGASPTPLEVASRHGSVAVVKKLIYLGAVVTEDAVVEATRLRRCDVISVLLMYGGVVTPRVVETCIRSKQWWSSRFDKEMFF
jgi:hypothetical protein